MICKCYLNPLSQECAHQTYVLGSHGPFIHISQSIRKSLFKVKGSLGTGENAQDVSITFKLWTLIDSLKCLI